MNGNVVNMENSEAAVLYSVSDQIATITLNRPKVLNALNEALLLGLRDAISACAADDNVRAVIITGAGRAFCAGADLSTMPTDDASLAAGFDLGRALTERYNPIILGIRALQKPVITVVNGSAAGAGMSIALAGDIIIAGQSASFLQAFARIGLIPDAGSTWFLPRYVGDLRARAMTMLAEPMDALEAQRIGMVWKVVPDAQLMDEAKQLATKLSRAPTTAIALIKEALNASGANTLPQQLALEAQLQTKAGRTHDFIEGIKAFIGKRVAQFTGK